MAVSQAKNILAHLVQHKTITPLEALNQYGCFRLSAVIFNLKKDKDRYEILDLMIDNMKSYSVLNPTNDIGNLINYYLKEF